MASFWAFEIWRALFVVMAAAVAGLWVGHVAWCLVIAACGYVIWLYFGLSRVERQLREDDGEPAYGGRGVTGELHHHISRLRDRHKRRERRLSEALNWFQQSAAALPDGAVVLRSQGEIVWLNVASKRLLGLRAREDLGQRIINLVRYPDFTRFFERGDYSEILEIPSPVDEDIILAIQVVPYGDDHRLLIARDVTYLHRLEQVRRDFVANVSHELRTPLTVISGYLENMINVEDQCTKRWGRSLTFMMQHTVRMQRLVEDLLLLSRLETEQSGDNQVQVAVPEMLEVIREEAAVLSGGKNHEIRLEADPNLWLRGNEKELRSAFSNLVTNAVQYTPEKGRIYIRWYADERGAHFQVRDTGIGIPERHIPRLTERFYRVDTGRSRQEGGTGLGLAIVKHVLQRHAGELHVESTVDKGSVFTCDFPAASIEIKPDAREKVSDQK